MPSEQAEQGDGGPDHEVVRKAIALTKTIEKLKLELKPKEDELKAMQPGLIKWFEETGAQRHTADGKTAYLRRELWVYAEKKVEKDEVMDALRAAGMGDFVKEAYNVQSISAFARELEKEADWEETGALLENAEHPLFVAHPELKGFLEPTEKFEVRIVQG